VKMTVFLDIAPWLIAFMMEAVRTSETSVNFETTRRNIPAGCCLIYHLSCFP
jgi:hypothetical protein